MKFKAKTFLIIISLLIVFLIIILITNNSDNEDNLENNINTNIDMINNPIYSRRQLIETEYIEFKDFENQNSFAGQSVKEAIIDSDYYFAYIVHGSGLPMVQATCFRVDRIGRVFKVGLFPDPLDSYAGYNYINPVNCKGIR
jgi:hypothetical protein